uniref:PIN domain-containing protein n=2 Tax=Oscillospiraceae TaxID=216572 RepID=UPI003FD830DF
MKIYLVDFENVKSKGLQGIDNLTETDTVIIFYSENSDTINFEMHQKVLTSKADIEYFKVNVGGKNALDFQLSTLLGYLVAKDTYTNIFVISNDRGFDFLHDFWHGKYVDSPNAMVYRTRTIQTAINFANHKVNPTENNEDEESTKHIVEKAEETEETAEIQTESEITLDEADESNPE